MDNLRRLNPSSASTLKTPLRPPVILSREEVRNLMAQLEGTRWLMAALLYAAGLRLVEALRLRINDVDLDARRLVIRDGEGNRSRLVPLAATLVEPMRRHFSRIRSLHEHDVKEGYGRVVLPPVVARKFPGADREWAWQYVFPSAIRSSDEELRLTRHHVNESAIQIPVKKAACTAGIAKSVSAHTLRYSFAAHLLQDGYDVRAVQELLGHSELVPMIYSKVLEQAGRKPRSALDRINVDFVAGTIPQGYRARPEAEWNRSDESRKGIRLAV
jgi:site-specific recombinase XerD